MSRLVAVGLIVGLLLPGCGGYHATLPTPPPRNAPYAERATAYEQLAPTEDRTDTTVLVSNRSVSVIETRTMVLKGGYSVMDARDFLPVVPPDSPTAQAAHRVDSALSKARTWKIVMWTSLVGGLALMLAGVKYKDTDGDGTKDVGLAPIFWVGVGVGTVIPVVAGLIAAHHSGVAYMENGAAFGTYGASLRAGLGICVDGLQLRDCDAAPVAPTTAAPADPAPATP